MEDFLNEISRMIVHLVATFMAVKGTNGLQTQESNLVGICPCCQSNVIERPKGFFCEKKECRFALWKNNRFLDSLSKTMTKSVAEKLLKDGKVRLKKCRSIKTGKTYDTTGPMSRKRTS